MVESARARLPSWMLLWAAMTAVIATISVGLAAFFALDHGGAIGQRLAFVCVAYGGVQIVGALPVALGLARPLRRLQRALDAGTPAIALPRADALKALRLPYAVVVGSLVLGVGAAVCFAWGATTLEHAVAPWPVFFIGGLCLAVISAISHGYAMRAVVVQRIAPSLLCDGRIDHLDEDAGAAQARDPGAPRPHPWVTPTWHHLGAAFITLAVAWPTFGYLVIVYGVRPDALAAFVILALYVTLMLQQLWGVLGSIAQPIGHLRDRMREIEVGHLDCRARVGGLDTFGVLSSTFNHMVEGLKQRELLKETFGRYVTKQVADEILAGRVALGGERRTATVLFSDIRDFTAMSEQHSPEEVVSFLNEYLAMMVDCVIEHGGVLDKFIGDAILAVFGAPVSAGSVAQDASAAVRCALAMGARLNALNATRAASGQRPIRIGIGVHTGELVAGNIGSPKRMQYTVIGDTVNVGSRLESLTKVHQRRTLVSGATAALVQDAAPLISLGTVSVRGRAEPLAIFGIEGEVGHAAA